MRWPSSALALIAAGAILVAPTTASAEPSAAASTAQVCETAPAQYPPTPPSPDCGTVVSSTSLKVSPASPKAAGTAPGEQGSLPRTGWDQLFLVLQLAGIALAVGALLSYVGRRRTLTT